MRAQEIIEQILFRRGLQHKLEGYTLETAIEICEALRPVADKIERMAEGSSEGYALACRDIAYIIRH